MVDVRGFEPLTPCLQSRLGKTLNASAGVAYTENQRRSRFSNVPKLYRVTNRNKASSRAQEKREQLPVPSLFACRVQGNRPQRAPRKLDVLP